MFTFGHGRATRDELATRLRDAGIERVVDVRRYPGSKSNPAAAKGQIEDLARELGIDYLWDERLGGRRHLTREEKDASPDTWWEHAAFRAYASWARTPEFRAAIADLLAGPEAAALMCSESVWWRCHRRLISDVLVLAHDIEVQHLLPGGRLVPHEVSAGARLTSDGDLVWDGRASDLGAPDGRASGLGASDGRASDLGAPDGGGSGLGASDGGASNPGASDPGDRPAG